MDSGQDGKQNKSRIIPLDNLSPRQIMEASACSRCGECQSYCPMYAQDERESITARGKAKMMTEILKAQHGLLARLTGKKGLSEERLVEIMDDFYKCTICGQCHFVCPSRIDTIELWEDFRMSMVRAGWGPLEGHAPLVSSIKNYDNPWGQPRAIRDKWATRAYKKKRLLQPIKDITKEKAEVLYYVGCTASYDQNISEVAIKTAAILQAAGVDFGILGPNEKCCGSTLRRIGDPEYKRLAKDNIEIFNDLGVKTIIFSCSGCFKTILQNYPLEADINAERVHMVPFMAKLIEEGVLKPKKEVPITVTYHDPCHLGRHVGIYDAPRKILNAIPGLKLVEMERSREMSLCCGSGGGVKAAFTEDQVKASEDRVAMAKATGATDFATACPFCYQSLQNAIESTGADMTMRDITELLFMSLE